MKREFSFISWNDNKVNKREQGRLKKNREKKAREKTETRSNSNDDQGDRNGRKISERGIGYLCPIRIQFFLYNVIFQ